MDKKLNKALTNSIRALESGELTFEQCLSRHPEHADELRKHLELWQGMVASSKTAPAYEAQYRGRQQMLTALAGMAEGGAPSMIRRLAPVFAKVTAVVAATALLVGGAAGASAALGGPSVADDVLSAIGVTRGNDDVTTQDATAEETLDDVDENTPTEADDGVDTAKKAEEDGLNNIAAEKANDEASTGIDAANTGGANADTAADNAQGAAPDTVPVGPGGNAGDDESEDAE